MLKDECLKMSVYWFFLTSWVKDNIEFSKENKIPWKLFLVSNQLFVNKTWKNKSFLQANNPYM